MSHSNTIKKDVEENSDRAILIRAPRALLCINPRDENYPRKHIRYPIDQKAVFKSDDWDMECHGSLKNLSSGGVCLETVVNMEVGQVIEIEAGSILPSENAIKGVVRWKSSGRYGIMLFES